MKSAFRLTLLLLLTVTAFSQSNVVVPNESLVVEGVPPVPVTESEQMVSVIRQNGTPVWWVMAKDEGHGFGKKKNQDYQFYATVMFVKEYLLK